MASGVIVAVVIDPSPRDLDSPYLGPLADVRALAALQRLYWAAVVRLLSVFTRSYSPSSSRT